MSKMRERRSVDLMNGNGGGNLGERNKLLHSGEGGCEWANVQREIGGSRSGC